LSAEIHPALEHPNDLFVLMLMCGSMCARLDFPPHGHAMLASKDAALHGRFACARLSQPCLSESSPDVFRNVHHHRF
jgi:hypothetical protein